MSTFDDFPDTWDDLISDALDDQREGRDPRSPMRREQERRAIQSAGQYAHREAK